MENFNNQQIPQYSGENQPYQQAYPPPLPPELAEEKRFKRCLYKIFGGNLLYEGVMFGTVIFIAIVIGIVIGVLMALDNSTDSLDTFLENYQNSDMGSTIAVLVATFFLGLFMWKVVKPKEIFQKQKSMNPKSFLMIFCVFYGCQLVFSILGTGLEALLNLIGYTAEEAVELASGGSESISMLIYAGFTAPIFEEIVFRGYMMKSFEKTGAGKGYAMLISSILFGVMHGNFVQAPFAFVVGFVLAYTAMEYGIVWSILIHFLNNFVMSEGTNFLIERVPETFAPALEYGPMLLFAVGAVIVLVLKRFEVKEYICSNYQTQKKYYIWTLTNPLFIIFCVICLLMSFLTITKLN